MTRILPLMLCATLALATPPREKDKGPTVRLLTGQVVDRRENPLPGAVVYISDSRTHDVKTYIVGKDGAYHFPGLSLNSDYEIYALFQGKKSDVKTVSQFDSRTQVNLDLKIAH